MKSPTPCISLVLLFTLVSFAFAHIADVNDEYWKKRASEAHATADAAYNPDPWTETDSFNDAVRKSLKSNVTGRSLRPIHHGACRALNPIDRCWRCKANWASNRQSLANCAKGFGRQAHGGGKNSKIYVVTDPSDDFSDPKPGTLRYAVIQPEPLWIIFAHDMVIHLKQELIMTSHKTVDGRGANVHITGGSSFMIQYISNVIIHGLHIHDIVQGSGGMVRDSINHIGQRTQSDGDGISIFGSSHVWVDHVSMSNCYDGLVDAVEGSTAITISNSHFTKHNEVMLFGASDSYSRDSIMQITVAFNHFGSNLVQRMPRARWGFVHVVNNDYTHWLMYAVGGSKHPTIVSQGNRYTAPQNGFAKEVTKRDYASKSEWMTWNWTSDGDLFRNGAFFTPSGAVKSSDLIKGFSKYDVIKAKPGSYVTRLTRYSGALNCVVGKPC